MRSLVLLLAGAAVLPLPALAQQAAAPAATPAAQDEGDDTDETAPDIVITGSAKPPGSVIGDIPPEKSISPAEIRSYGVGSVAELLTELAPQTRSDRGSGGQPVVLVNGRRISGFQEIRDLPTEAIQRVDILPEEVALKYGYRADQRVVNFVLRPRFRAKTVELNDRFATDGGRNAPEGKLDYVRINRGGRLSAHVEASSADALTEAQRNIVQTPAAASLAGTVTGSGASSGIPVAAQTGAAPLAAFAATPAPVSVDQAPYRTLLPRTHSLEGSATYATSIGTVAATFNGSVNHDTSASYRGVPTTSILVPVGNPFSPFAVPVTVSTASDVRGALDQRSTTTDAHLGASFNGDEGRWRWSANAVGDLTDSDTRTQTGLDTAAFQRLVTAGDPNANPFAVQSYFALPDNTGRSRSTSAGLNALASGPLFALPAGDVSTSIRLSGTTSDLTSHSFRNGTPTDTSIGRDTLSTQANVDVPIARRSKDVLAFLGDLSLNANIELERDSGFSTQTTYGYGANWSPLTGVRVIASTTHSEDAPSATQLGNPIVTTPGVTTFDYVTGTTALVTTVTGGNPFLRASTGHVTKLGLDVKPWSAKDVSFVANYVDQHTDDPIVSFPAASAAIEAAFPDRFTRVGGVLTRVDTRPINFLATERSELRYGVNLSFALKSTIQKQFEAYRAGTGPNPMAGLREAFGDRRRRAPTRPDGSAVPATPSSGATGAPPQSATNAASDTPPTPPTGERPQGGYGGDGGGRGGRGGFGGGRGFGGGGFGGRGNAGGRVQFALYHTIHFSDRVIVADGGPVLDLLRGDATSSNGGTPRHEVEGQAGYSNNGIGVRTSLNFRSGTRVNGGTPAAPEELDFGSLTTVNVRLFADLGQRLDLVKAHPWLRGVRVVVSADNLFNQRQRVTDSTGTVPVGFQPGLLDPLGRTVRVSLRKLFF